MVIKIKYKVNLIFSQLFYYIFFDILHLFSSKFFYSDFYNYFKLKENLSFNLSIF